MTCASAVRFKICNEVIIDDPFSAIIYKWKDKNYIHAQTKQVNYTGRSRYLDVSNLKRVNASIVGNS